MNSSPDIAPPARPILAAFWMLGAVSSFSAMALAGRAVSTELDTFEIMTYRSLIGFMILIAVLGATGRMRRVTAQRLGLHLVRNLFHFAGQNLWFLALTLIPLAQVFALEFSYPIWVVLFSPLFLAERMTRTRILTALGGFLGILLVTRPGLTELNIGTLCALLAATGFAAAAITTKILTRTQPVASILFWLTVTQSVFGLICAGYDGDIALPSMQALPLVGLIAFAGLSAHFCLTKALKLAPAAVVTPLDFARLPIIAIIGALFYAEPLDPFVILGGAAIFAANYAGLRSERAKLHAVT